MYFYIYLTLGIVLAGFILGAVDLAIHEPEPDDECFTPEEKARLSRLSAASRQNRSMARDTARRAERR